MTSDGGQHSARGRKEFYIYDLPYNERKQLCSLLDADNCWKEIGGRYLDLNRAELDAVGKEIMRKESPTDELLNRMETLNYPVLKLFEWLYQMKCFRAMNIIKSFVDPKHHHLIPINVGLEQKIFSTWRSENTNSTLVDTYNNKENIKDNVRRNELTKHGNERTTERKLSEGSELEKLDSSIPFIPFEELEQATDRWNSSRKLGRGGFGVVYRGYWRETDIAIKRLEPPKRNEAESNIPGVQMQQSLKELKHLNISRHDNILPLYGYSIHDQKYVLVYQFMPHGSLDDRLHRTNSEYLSWNIKYKIAKGTARGLQFLHGMNPPLIHGDIKSANILLDQYYDPKIGDFGLAREGPKAQYTHVNVSRIYGTRPYLPYEFLRSKKFSKKVDVYSFGVVLFEIATGKKPYEDARSEKFLKDYICNYEESFVSNLMDPRGKYENHLYLSLYKLFIDLGKECVHSTPKHRPEMIDVFKTLDKHEKGRPNSPFHVPHRNSLIPPSCTTVPATTITPLGSHDRRRSPSPTHQPVGNIPHSPLPSQSPRNLTPIPSGSNQTPRSLTPVLSPSPMQVVTEVSSSDKASSAGNGVAHLESYALVEQNLSPIPDIKLIPPHESRTSVSNGEATSISSLSILSSESEESTHSTNTSNGSAESEVRSEDETENKEVTSDQIPLLSILLGSNKPAKESSDILRNN